MFVSLYVLFPIDCFYGFKYSETIEDCESNDYLFDYYYSAKGSFSFWTWDLNVYFRKIFGQTAKFTITDINTIGSTPILSPKSTTNGPHIAPINPKA